MTGYDTLFFDMDGTVVDSASGLLRSVCTAFEAAKRPRPTDAQLRACLGPTFSMSLATIFGITGEESAFMVSAFRESYGGGNILDFSAYSGMPELIQKLHSAGSTLYIASAKQAAMSREQLRKLGIEDCFTGVFGSEWGDVCATKTLIFDRALPSLSFDRSRAAMIGDRASDIEAAHAHCFAGIAVLFGYGTPTELAASKPEHTVSTVAELSRLLAK